MTEHAYMLAAEAWLQPASWACLAGTALLALLVLGLVRWWSTSNAPSSRLWRSTSFAGLARQGRSKRQNIGCHGSTSCNTPPDKTMQGNQQTTLQTAHTITTCSTETHSRLTANPARLPSLEQPTQHHAKKAVLQQVAGSNGSVQHDSLKGEAEGTASRHQPSTSGGSQPRQVLHQQDSATDVSVSLNGAVSDSLPDMCLQQQQACSMASNSSGLAPRLSWPPAIILANTTLATNEAGNAAKESSTARQNVTTDGICVHTADDVTSKSTAAKFSGRAAALQTAASLPNPGQLPQAVATCSNGSIVHHGAAAQAISEHGPAGVSSQLASLGSSLLASLRRSISKGSKHERKPAKVMVSGKHGEKRALFNKNKVLPTPTMYAMIHPRPAASTPDNTCSAAAAAAATATLIAAGCVADPVLHLSSSSKQLFQPPIGSPCKTEGMRQAGLPALSPLDELAAGLQQDRHLLHPFLRMHTEHAFAPLPSGISDASSYHTAADLGYHTRPSSLLHSLQQQPTDNIRGAIPRTSEFAVAVSMLQPPADGDDDDHAGPHSSNSSLDLLLCRPAVLDTQMPPPNDSNNSQQQAADLQAGLAIQQAKTAKAAAEAWADVYEGACSASGLLRSSACSLLSPQDCSSPHKLCTSTLDGLNSPARSSALNPYAASWDSLASPRQAAGRGMARLHTVDSEVMEHAYEDAHDGKHGRSSIDSIKGRLPSSILGSSPSPVPEHEHGELAGMWDVAQYGYDGAVMPQADPNGLVTTATPSAAACMWQPMAWGQSTASCQQASIKDPGAHAHAVLGSPFAVVYNAAGMPSGIAPASTLPAGAMTQPTSAALPAMAAATAAGAGKLSIGVPVFQPPALLMGPHMVAAGVDAMGSPRLIAAGRPQPMLAVCSAGAHPYHLMNAAAMPAGHALVNLGGGMLLVQPQLQLVQLSPTSACMAMQPGLLAAAPATAAFISSRQPFKTSLTASVMPVKHAGALNGSSSHVV